VAGVAQLRHGLARAARDTAPVLVVYHAGLADFNQGRFCAVLQSENG
jgi:hypothetical protein